MQKVKHGDLVTFECINRDNFEEMIPEGPEIHRICKVIYDLNIWLPIYSVWIGNSKYMDSYGIPGWPDK